MTGRDNHTSSQNEHQPYVSTREAAEICGCHPQTMLRMAKAGTVPAIKVGQEYRFRIEAVLTALAV